MRPESRMRSPVLFLWVSSSFSTDFGRAKAAHTTDPSILSFMKYVRSLSCKERNASKSEYGLASLIRGKQSRVADKHTTADTEASPPQLQWRKATFAPDRKRAARPQQKGPAHFPHTPRRSTAASWPASPHSQETICGKQRLLQREKGPRGRTNNRRQMIFIPPRGHGSLMAGKSSIVRDNGGKQRPLPESRKRAARGGGGGGGDWG